MSETTPVPAEYLSAEVFNRLFDVGVTVHYHPVIGQPECQLLRTSTLAFVDNGRELIRLEGKAGYVSLAAVSVHPELVKYGELGRVVAHPLDCRCPDCLAFLAQGEVVRKLGLSA
jgi:hypothetical protein